MGPATSHNRILLFPAADYRVAALRVKDACGAG
jgi:hypothetical protein